MVESLRASIIINNYNYGRFLGEAIESALVQTYPSTEVIVVDDGSTDDSSSVIGSFGTRVIGVFKQNGGQASAYNAGFRRCRGEAVCFLDADDTLDARAIESAIALLREPTVVKVQWPLRVVDVGGTWRGELSTKITPPAGNLRARVTRDGPLYDFHFTTGAAYRRSFLEEVLPAPEPQYRNGGDVYLITLAPVFGEIRNAPEALGIYRAHGNNNYRDRRFDDERIRDCIRRFDINAAVLHEALAARGIRVDINDWKKRNFNYLWPHRLLQAKQDIASLVPPGSSYILVNGDEWGAAAPVAGRTAIPFLERAHQYGGPPADDDEAIAELIRLRAAGAAFIVIWWTSFWWLDHYRGFHAWLRAHFPCTLDNDRLLAFDIRDNHGTATAIPGAVHPGVEVNLPSK